MRTLTITGALMVFATVAPAQEAPLEFDLRCNGMTTRSGVSTQSESYINSAGQAAIRQRSVPYNRAAAGLVRFQSDGDQGGVTLPSDLVATTVGSKQGWWVLSELRKSDTEITAQIKVGLFRELSLRIDRMTGDIGINSSNGVFVGKCAPVGKGEPLF